MRANKTICCSGHPSSSPRNQAADRHGKNVAPSLLSGPMTRTSFDITTPAMYLQDVPHDTFRAMRAEPGLTWHGYDHATGSPSKIGGFWAATRHADVATIGRNADVFSSAVGHTNLWDLEADALTARRSLIDSDAPDHTRLRRIVSSAFTPKYIREWEAITRSIAGALLDDFLETSGGDWVEAVVAALPIQVIMAILGVPSEDGDFLIELSNYLVEGTTDRPTLSDDAYGNTTPTRLLPFGSPAAHALYEYGASLGIQRKENPGDDVVSRLVLAEVDGEHLTQTEYKNFFQLLVFAGNETTRTAIAHGTIAFADYPEQWQRLLDDASLLQTAVEEVIRWSSPVLHMRRTATVDTEVAGTSIAKGDKVVMWYVSSNRDEAVWESPDQFDITRSPNPQQSFGGGGPHFCLGAFLARMEISVLIEEMLARNITLQRVGEPTRVASNFIRGVLDVEMIPG